MPVYFFVLAILNVIFGLFMGYQVDNIFLGFVSGVMGGSIFMGIGVVIENQQIIQSLIQKNLYQTDHVIEEEITCIKCGKAFGKDRKSCPYCGQKKE